MKRAFVRKRRAIEKRERSSLITASRDVPREHPVLAGKV